MQYNNKAKFIHLLIGHHSQTDGGKSEEILKSMSERDILDLASDPETAKLVEKWRKLDQMSSFSSNSGIKKNSILKKSQKGTNKDSSTNDEENLKNTLTTDISVEKNSSKSKTPKSQSIKFRELKKLTKLPSERYKRVGSGSPQSPKRGLLNNYFSRNRYTSSEKTVQFSNNLRGTLESK